MIRTRGAACRQPWFQRAVIESHLQAHAAQLTLPAGIDDISAAARAAVAADDAVSLQLLLDGNEAAARAWLHRLLTALLTRTDERKPPHE